MLVALLVGVSALNRQSESVLSAQKVCKEEIDPRTLVVPDVVPPGRDSLVPSNTLESTLKVDDKFLHKELHKLENAEVEILKEGKPYDPKEDEGKPYYSTWKVEAMGGIKGIDKMARAMNGDEAAIAELPNLLVYTWGTAMETGGNGEKQLLTWQYNADREKIEFYYAKSKMLLRSPEDNLFQNVRGFGMSTACYWKPKSCPDLEYGKGKETNYTDGSTVTFNGLGTFTLHDGRLHAERGGEYGWMKRWWLEPEGKPNCAVTHFYACSKSEFEARYTCRDQDRVITPKPLGGDKGTPGGLIQYSEEDELLPASTVQKECA
jgi:hypothetical protein